ncbi:MAG: acyltransferase [Lachnospiraceae bacterium]|nr:acyltransferase [Lachnospiraceae bacterium]
MKLLKYAYEKVNGKPAPYYYDYSILTIIGKPLRKWVCQVIAPNCVFNNIRILLYRLCGFKIGKNVFIGMRCYLDDMCYDLLTIGNNVTISYGVYFACHGRNQKHYPILIEDDAYIGMKANVISKNIDGMGNGVRIGNRAIIGACSLVNRDIPDGATAVGVPCRITKITRDQQ